jgi:RNA polymerase sigma factor (TIGR02999 family)
MMEITRILSAIDAGDPHAANQLMPMVYEELRKLAAGHMANERPDHTLDATGLVHEAYLRLTASAGGESEASPFANRRHFFAAAAEAMRRILVDSARKKRARKRDRTTGVRVDLDGLFVSDENQELWIDLDQALTTFASIDPDAAELAKLRIFGGLSAEEAAEALGLSRATGFRTWTYARAWLAAALSDQTAES